MKGLSFALSLFLCGGVLFSGGAKQQASSSGGGGGNDSLKEAPKLAALVAAGKLPPLEQRLPVSEDIMVELGETNGAYGDHLTMSYRGKNDQWMYGKIMEEALFRFTNEGTIEPNVAKGFDLSSDAREYTIYLRQGLKWSDGMPFTVDDCIFFFEHMCKPQSFGKTLWDCFYSTNPQTKQRTVCVMEKVNDYVFKVKFSDPSPNFLELLAINGKWMFAPAHWYKQILPEFIGEAAAAAKAKEMGYSDVVAMGLETGYYYWNVLGRPTLRPWIAVTKTDSELLIYERNPYYWKTDSMGRQLPYIDEVHFVRISDENQKLLKIMAGEIDVAPDLPYSSIVALKQNEKGGNYKLLNWASVAWSAGPAALQLNLTTENANLRILFQNKDFRQALSIAADRNEMNNIVMDGFAKPTQASPAEGAMGYSKAWAEKWTEYNPQKAKQLLEKSCGLKMGTDGYYRYPDGSALTLEILSYDERSAVAKVAELLTEKYFKNIGIRAFFGIRDRSLIDELAKANKLTAVISPVAPMSTINITLRPDTLVPVRNYAVWYGTYGDWYVSNGQNGTKPEGDILKLIDLYREMLSSTNKDAINKIALQMLKLHEENIWQIGYFSDPPMLMAVSNNLKNFRETAINCDEFRNLGIAHMAVCYFETDKR
jgi:peptide/nickel transport system substrate-binding protein